MAIQLYSVRDILNKVDNKDGKCDAAYTAHSRRTWRKWDIPVLKRPIIIMESFMIELPDEFKNDVESAGMKVLSSHCTRGLSKEELASGDFSEFT